MFTNLRELDIDVSDVTLFFLQWVVVVVEVRPNLLSGESERFCLEEICQVRSISSFLCILPLDTLEEIVYIFCCHLLKL